MPITLSHTYRARNWPTRAVLLAVGIMLPGIAALSGPSFAAQGSPAVAIDSRLYVEHTGPDDTRRLEPGLRFVTGDRVVTLLRWRRPTSGGGFTVTNALPPRLAFLDSAEPGTEVSVDGGHSWGQLGVLRKGARLAGPEDVTHLRWRIRDDSAHSGSLLYSGVVR